MKYWLVDGVTEEDIILERQLKEWVLELLIAVKTKVVFKNYYKIVNNNVIFF
jgi:hypothetical protein